MYQTDNLDGHVVTNANLKKERIRNMKKLFAALALTLFASVMITGTSLAECPSGDCGTPPVVTPNECPGGVCDGGFVNGWNTGNLWGEADVDAGNSVWGQGCSSLEMGTIAGAPMDGEASIINTASQGLDILKEREDGTGGVRLQDSTLGKLETTALNGGLEGGAIFSENHMRADMTSDTWDTGLTANMHNGIDMAGMVCATEGTIGTLESQAYASSFQNTDNGKGIKTFQQSEMLGTLKVNVNADTTP